jgi:murein DD-endopeptidase MepM/ murein hydrolase activator NlpD
VILRPALLTLLLLAGGCETLGRIPDALFDHRTARERYQTGLELARLSTTALVRDWQAAAERALDEAPLIPTPHSEEGVLLAAEPQALAWRFMVRQGQSVHFEFALAGDSTALVFLEAWRISDDTLTPPQLEISADSGERALSFEPRRDGEYLVRAQTELLRGGRFTATLRLAPILAFPVANGRERDIGSWFGAPRDGGREHHGVDIFARRGTPVLAATAGRVTRIAVNNLGGNIVWLRDDRGYSFYYAHLDRSTVAEGAEVLAGDTVGMVGNTGNAIRTPPHLHFGIYRRGEGPVDPRWFVQQPRGTIATLAIDTTFLGGWVRTRIDGAILRIGPARDASPVATLSQHAVLRGVSGAGSWLRAVMPDGRSGYLLATGVENADRTVETARLQKGEVLLVGPEAARAEMVTAEAGGDDQVEVLGRFETHLLVRTSAGRDGWIRR